MLLLVKYIGSCSTYPEAISSVRHIRPGCAVQKSRNLTWYIVITSKRLRRAKQVADG
jgi:hypothetical protein